MQPPFTRLVLAESCWPLTCQILSISLWVLGAALFGVMERLSYRVASGYFPDNALKQTGTTLYMTVINLMIVPLLMIIIYAFFP